MADTTNYTWTKPTVGGSQDAWGTILNTALDDIDTDLKTVDDAAVAAQADATTGIADAATADGKAVAAQATADAALPKAGGVMTGQLDAKTGTLAYATQATASGDLTFNMNTANVHQINLTGDATNMTPSNVPGESGFMDVIILDITKNAYTISSWAGFGTIEWAGGGSAPTLNGHDVILLLSYDGGTNWQGSVIQSDLQ